MTRNKNSGTQGICCLVFLTSIVSFVLSSSAATLTIGSGGTYSTIADAMNIATEGDILEIVDSGTYNEQVIFSQNDLTLRGKTGQAKPTISFGSGNAVVDCNGKTGITVEHLVIDGQTTTEGWYPFYTGRQSANNLVEDCEVKNVTYFMERYSVPNAGGYTVKETKIHNVKHKVFQIQYMGYTTSGAHGLTITNCLIYDIDTSGDNWEHAIYLPDIYPNTPVSIVNTTIYAQGTATQHHILFQQWGTKPQMTLTFKNNLVWDMRYGFVINANNLTDIEYSNIEAGDLGDFGPGCIQQNPSFVDAANDDFHLSNYSPCIGAGTSSGAPSIDIEDNPRPNPSGANPDMGAYESSRSSPLTLLTVGSGGVFSTIADAMAAATKGNTLEIIDSGAYNEQVVFAQDNLTLRGKVGQARPTITFGSGNAVIDCNGKTGITLKHLVIDGQATTEGWYPFYTGSQSANNLMEDCEAKNVTYLMERYSVPNAGGYTVRETKIHNVKYKVFQIQYMGYTTSGAHGLTITNCLIYDIDTSGSNWQPAIYLPDMSENTPVSIVNTTLYGQGTSTQHNTFFQQWGTKPRMTLTFKNNIFWNMRYGFVINSNNLSDIQYSDIQVGNLNDFGFGCIQEDPLFVDVANDDFHLKSTSPCIDAGTSNGAPSIDIDGNGRPNPVGSSPDMGAYESPAGGGGGGGLFVELESFSAVGSNGQVALSWSTASEIDSAAFNVLRSNSPDGQFDIINYALIPARGDSLSGADYAYTDYTVLNGSVYYYMLEEFDINGGTHLYGPVTAAPGMISLLNPVDGGYLSLDDPVFEVAASPDVRRAALYVSSSPTLKGKGTMRLRVRHGKSKTKLGRRAKKRLAKLDSANGSTLYCGVYGLVKGKRGMKLLSNVTRFSVLPSAL